MDKTPIITEKQPNPNPESKEALERKPDVVEIDEDAVTSYSDYICKFRAPTKFDFDASIKSIAEKDKETKNLCGKRLASGKRCQTENVGGCANTGCSVHYGWQDEVEGFRLRTF